jgi:hypothetical protein
LITWSDIVSLEDLESLSDKVIFKVCFPNCEGDYANKSKLASFSEVIIPSPPFEIVKLVVIGNFNGWKISSFRTLGMFNLMI